MNARENIVVKELDDILSLYTSYKEEVEKRKEEKRDIENLINANTQMNVTSTKSRTLRENVLTQLKEELNQIQIPVKPELVTFACEPGNLLAEIGQLGRLVKAIDSIDALFQEDTPCYQRVYERTS